MQSEQTGAWALEGALWLWFWSKVCWAVQCTVDLLSTERGRRAVYNPLVDQMELWRGVASAHSLSLRREVPDQFSEWRNNQWNPMLESLNLEDQSICNMNRWVMRFPTPLPSLVTPEGNCSLGTPKKCNSLEAMTVYTFAPASEPILTNSAEF